MATTSTTDVVLTPQRRARRRAARRHRTALSFMAPWIIGFSAFVLYPMLASLYYSFTDYDLLSNPEWVGLDNYRFMFTKDPRYWQAFRNTVWIILVGVPLQALVALGTAMLLTRPRRGSRVYRTIFFLPRMAPPVAAALAFVFVFNPVIGPVNQLLDTAGLDDPPLWFFSPVWSKWGLVFLGIWGCGQTMVIYLAGLVDVPRHLYEAAEVEGAGAWQKFRFITLPMISPAIFFSLVTGVIYGFQYFTEAYVASFAVAGQPTGSSAAELGSPQGSLLFYSLYLYVRGFTDFRMGYASAMAWVLFLITMACTVLLIRSSRHWVHYAAGGFR